MEKHVTNLEISKRLEELGVKPGLFAWAEYNEGGLFIADSNDKQFGEDEYFRKSYCWLASELGELLPTTIKVLGKMYYLHIQKKYDHWYVALWDSETQFDARFEKYQESEYLPDAMGKMLIYLLENNLITVSHK